MLQVLGVQLALNRKRAEGFSAASHLHVYRIVYALYTLVEQFHHSLSSKLIAVQCLFLLLLPCQLVTSLTRYV